MRLEGRQEEAVQQSPYNPKQSSSPHAPLGLLIIRGRPGHQRHSKNVVQFLPDHDYPTDLRPRFISQFSISATTLLFHPLKTQSLRWWVNWNMGWIKLNNCLCRLGMFKSNTMIWWAGHHSNATCSFGKPTLVSEFSCLCLIVPCGQSHQSQPREKFWHDLS